MNDFTGTVSKSTGSWYKIIHPNGGEVDARLKGRFRLGGRHLTNPVTVGDVVDVNVDRDGLGVIHRIHPRKNYLIRKSTKLSSQFQMVAANIDRALILATIVKPKTSQGFIDRFLITCESFGIPAFIIFNKVDLLNSEQMQTLNERTEDYRSMGYSVFHTSLKDGKCSEDLLSNLKTGVSLLFGHSGVGKSTLINILIPNAGQQVSEISTFHGKGKHTTTFARMLTSEAGFRIIDTPGVKEFGMEPMEAWKLSHYFRDLKNTLGGCRFSNCLHSEEPDCAVLSAVEEGKISLKRYESYLSILGEIQEAK